MQEAGNFFLAALFVFAAYAVTAAVLGARLERASLVSSAERAIIFATVSGTLAVACLATSLVRGDFAYEYVANYTNRELPIPYRLAALWAGNDGSLLFWNWLLVVFAAVVVWQNRSCNRGLMPYVVAVIGGIIAYFAYLNYWVCNPFDQLGVVMSAGDIRAWTPLDGRGLNPLLQHPIMVVHPPILYIGYVGFAIPFAFCLAALFSRELDTRWITTTRRWTLFAWFFLGMGILLGARWAYVELGWGGYWAWDPVENASLMPWLTATAYLHSVIIQERKGMLKVWNVVLIVVTYLLCILGTFLTRSGIVSSVHAFAGSEFAWQFVVFLLVAGTLSAWLIVSRRKELRSENELDSIASREASFLFNNLLFLVACFAVLWGTLFPVMSEAVTGEKASVGPPFFNRVSIPIALALLFLTGVGPSLAWRKTSLNALKRSFLMPAAIGTACGTAILATGMRDAYAFVCWSLSAFVLATIAQEFHRAARARAAHKKAPYVVAIAELFRVNTRRYGGYVVHMGMVLIFVGIGGSAFDRDVRADFEAGDTIGVGSYEVEFHRYEDGGNPNYDWMAAVVELRRDGEVLGTFDPQKHIYKASGQPTSEVRRYSTFREDVYFVFGGITDNGKAILHIFVNPLVRWIWIGALVIFVGSLIAMLPDRRELKRVRQPVEPRTSEQRLAEATKVVA
jgi:cytochrome c-type biogenesis protein CcmF